MASSSSSFRLKQQQQQQRERPKSRREALIEKYVERPRTHQLALEQADTTCIRTGSPVRYSPARRFEHVVTSVFGAGGSPKIPKGADNDWCTKGLVIAGESCSPVLQRLSHPTNFTKSYTKRRSYPHVADINELTAFPRYSERDTEYLESLRIRKFVAEERRNPEVCASSHPFCLNVQSNRNLFRHPSLPLLPLLSLPSLPPPGTLLVELCPLRWREAKELLEQAVALRDEGLQEYMAGLKVHRALSKPCSSPDLGPV